MRGSSMTEEHAKNRAESMHIGNTSVATRKVISFYGR